MSKSLEYYKLSRSIMKKGLSIPANLPVVELRRLDKAYTKFILECSRILPSQNLNVRD